MENDLTALSAQLQEKDAKLEDLTKSLEESTQALKELQKEYNTFKSD